MRIPVYKENRPEVLERELQRAGVIEANGGVCVSVGAKSVIVQDYKNDKLVETSFYSAESARAYGEAMYEAARILDQQLNPAKMHAVTTMRF